jgi:hypothetical protein
MATKNSKPDKDAPIAPLVAQITADYRASVDKYVDDWNKSAGDTLNVSELVRIAVARYISFEYVKGIRTRVKRYATEAERDAAKANSQAMNAEKLAVKSLFTKLVTNLVNKGMMAEMIALTEHYNMLRGPDDILLKSAGVRATTLDALKSAAHQYDIKIIERSVKNKDTD